MKIKLLTALVTSILLSGCALNKMPDKTPKEFEYSDIEARTIQEWREREQAIKYIDANVSFGIERRNIVPDEIKKIELKNLTIDSNGTFRMLAALLKEKNINLFIPDDEIANSNFIVKNYNGTLGSLMDVIEDGYNLSFNHSGGRNIILRRESIFVAPIPQDDESAKDLVDSINALGATGSSYSLSGGFMIYRSTNESQRTIQEYLDNYYKNFAVIKLQAAIITVNLENERNSGFDWSSFQAVLGNANLLSLSGDAGGTIGAIIGDPTSQPTTPTERPTGRAIGMNSSTLKGAYLRGNKDIQAAFNLLNTYGATNATQSIFLETISGKELKLVSGKEVPYSSGINSNIVGNGNTGNVSSLSGFQSQKEEEGLTVTFKPYFNYNKSTVTLSIDLELKSIVGFVELNAGNSNGTVEQPITQKQEFNSVVEIRPGEAHLIGGITFELDSDNRNNLNFLNMFPTASKKRKSNKNALFILLRPTVSIYHAGLSAEKGGE